MAPRIKPLTQRPAWKALQAHCKSIRELHLRELFARGPSARRVDDGRGGGHLSRLFQEPRDRRHADAARQLAEESGLQAQIEAMFSGEKINVTENRAVLHVALRVRAGASIVVDGENVVPQVHAVLDKMADFVTACGAASGLGHTGKRIRHVVNIGIGGSDLGPVMAYEALKHYSDRSLRSGLCRTSTAPTSPKPCRISTRPKRCSSFPPRRSRRSRP